MMLAMMLSGLERTWVALAELADCIMGTSSPSLQKPASGSSLVWIDLSCCVLALKQPYLKPQSALLVEAALMNLNPRLDQNPQLTRSGPHPTSAFSRTTSSNATIVSAGSSDDAGLAVAAALPHVTDGPPRFGNVDIETRREFNPYDLNLYE